MRLRIFAPLAFALCAVAGCDEQPVEPIVPVSVVVAPSLVPAMTVGQTVQLIAIVSGATNATVIWSSSAPSVATVGVSLGVVTCVSAGVAVITATSVADPNARQGVVVQCLAPTQAVSITTAPTSLSFTHQVNTTGCPQVVGTVEVANTSAIDVQVTVASHSALTVDVTAFTLAPGASRTVTVRFNCSTQTSFVGNVTFTAAGGGAVDVKTVQVTSTIN